MAKIKKEEKETKKRKKNMERMTESIKVDDNTFCRLVDDSEETEEKAIEKLCKLEDLEETIGMPLEEVINLMAGKIWIVDNNKIIATRFDGLNLKNTPNIFVVNYFNEQKTIYKSQEEAERKLEELKKQKKGKKHGKND